MARTRLADATADKIVNRLAMLLLKEEHGSDDQAASARIQLDAVTWTLRTLGYNDDIINDLSAQAEQLAV